MIAGPPQRFAPHRVHVDQLVGFLLREDAPRVGDGDPLAHPLLRQEPAEHLAHVAAGTFVPADHPDREVLLFLDLDLDQAHVEEPALDVGARAGADALRLVVGDRLGRRLRRLLLLLRERVAEDRTERGGERVLLLRLLRDRLRVEEIDDPLDRGGVGGLAHVGAPFVRDHPDRRLGEIADHRLDVAADVADLGVLRRLDLDERRAGERGQAARDLGLPHAGRSDHQDVLRGDLFADGLGQPLATVAVAHRDGNGALGVGLADDVAVERSDDLARGELSGRLGRDGGDHKESTSTLSLV